MPKDKVGGQRGYCRVCGKPISGGGRLYCEDCQPCNYRVVMERKLGRALEPQEVVHHIDGDRTNNDPDNLQVFPSHGMHMAHHSTLQKRKIAHGLEQIGRDDWLMCWYDLEAPFDGIKRYLRACGYEGLTVWHAHCIVLTTRNELVTHHECNRGLHTLSKWAELAHQHEKTFLTVVNRYIANLKGGGQTQAWVVIPRILREVVK